jgi:hypothetical protein
MQAINLMKEGLNASVIKQRSKERELDSAYEAMSAQLDEYKVRALLSSTLIADKPNRVHEIGDYTI